MAGRITTPFQRALTSTVNNIEHLEATSYNGFGVVKVYFHPTVDINMANAQVTAVAQTMVRQMPSGTQPPLIMNYSASTVPVLQLALSGKGLTEQQLADLAMNHPKDFKAIIALKIRAPSICSFISLSWAISATLLV